VGLKYAAWHGDMPHEVARVTQPYRVVLLYRLFKRGDVPCALMARPLVDDVRRHFASIFNVLPLCRFPSASWHRSISLRMMTVTTLKCKRAWRCPALASSYGTPIRQRDCVRTR
jgi:hypothetical protein